MGVTSKIIKSVLLITLIVTAFFAAFDTYMKLAATSTITGTIVLGDETRSVIQIEIDYLVPTQTSNPNIYKYTDELPGAEFDGTKNDYQLYFNGKRIARQEVFPGYLTGSTTLSFYDIDGAERSTDITIRIEFYNDVKTILEMTFTNQNAAIDRLQRYVALNGITLNVAY